MRSTEYNSVEECAKAFVGFRNAHTGFYPCTSWLKKRVRKKWEYEHSDYDITYVWGMDCNEKQRADRLIVAMTEFNHCFPLIDRDLSKQNCYGTLKAEALSMSEHGSSVMQRNLLTG